MNKYFEATNRLLSHIDTIHWVEGINIGDKDLYEQDKKTIWELVEKATPKKTVPYTPRNVERYYCGECDLRLKKSWVVCPRCATRIDWSEEDVD